MAGRHTKCNYARVIYNEFNLQTRLLEGVVMLVKWMNLEQLGKFHRINDGLEAMAAAAAAASKVQSTIRLEGKRERSPGQDNIVRGC